MRHTDRHRAGKAETSRFGPVLFGLMSVGLLSYCGLNYLQVRNATRVFGPFELGMQQADVRYQFGQPQAQHLNQPVGPGRGTSVWTYESTGSKISLVFASDGRLASITCFQEKAYDGTCPSDLGVGIGATESDLTRLLGPPDMEHYDREDKIARYNGLGLMVRMRKLRVVEIGHSPATSAAGMAKVVMWRMFP
jgi:hypothetical protein